MRNLLLCLGIILLLFGCTNNPTVLKVLYGQFDNFMASELLDYADFTDNEEQTIRAAVDQTSQWHRYEALPSYVDFLTEAQARLVDRQVTPHDIDWIFERSRDLAKEFEVHSPLVAIRSVIKNLNQQQVRQIRRKIDKKFLEEQREMDKQADQNQAELATKNLTKFFKRIGLRLNQEQKVIATSFLAKRRISEQDRMPIWRGWADELVETIENRESVTFTRDFQTHYTNRSTLIKRTFKEDWQHDQDLTKAMLLELFSSLSDGQKQAMRERWAGLRAVGTDLATR